MVVLSFNPRPVCVGSKRNIESIQCIYIYIRIYIYIHIDLDTFSALKVF